MTLCTLAIAIVTSAALIAVYIVACRRLPQQPVARPAADTDNDDAYLAMFSVAHDDIWWAKEHAWTIVTAALATLVAVLLVDFSTKPSALLRFLSVSLVVVTAASNWYVARMQADMAVARIRSAFLIQRCSKLSHVVAEVVVGDLTDYNRGAGFMVVLIVLTSAVGGTTIWVLENSSSGALVAYVVLLGWGLCNLFIQVMRRAAREKPFTSRAA